MTEVSSLGTILGVWAHPDDETYLSAGLMATAASRGARVACATATRGEEGSWDHERYPPSEMARIRDAELIAALGVLGVMEHYWLGFRDGTCDAVTEAEGVDRVKTIIEKVDPDTILTFGPEGLTGHPDHRAVSRWTTKAFDIAAKPGATLCYTTSRPKWAAEFVPILNSFTEVYTPGLPPTTPEEELEIGFLLTDDLVDLKLRALKEQISQFEPFLHHFGEDRVRDFLGTEDYALAHRKADVMTTPIAAGVESSDKGA
jgi:LmbE family N-acetylglucosaminyl deacetylase